MTEFPTTSRKKARAALDAARATWSAAAPKAARVHHDALLRAVASQPVAVAVAERHAPFVSGVAGSGPECSSCLDPDDSACGDPGCCGPPESLPYPCSVITETAAKVGAEVPPLDLPPYPVWSDFYVDPQVTITLAHHTTVGDEFLPPKTEVTMPLGDALGFRYRMTAESWKKIEEMNRS